MSSERPEADVELINKNDEHYKHHKPELRKRHVFSHSMMLEDLTLDEFRKETKDDAGECIIGIEEELGTRLVIYKVEDEPVEDFVKRQQTEQDSDYQEWLRLKAKFGG